MQSMTKIVNTRLRILVGSHARARGTRDKIQDCVGGHFYLTVCLKLAWKCRRTMILVSISVFSGSSNPIALARILCDITGNGKIKMVASKIRNITDSHIYQRVN